MYSFNNQMSIQTNDKLLTGYFLFNYPNEKDFIDLLQTASKKGVDIFEVGFPSRNPHKDGEVIRKSQAVIDQKLVYNVQTWKNLRNHITAPICVMGYKEDLIDTKFYLELCKECQIDGLVVPDLSYEENIELQEEVSKYQTDVVPFILENEENIDKYASHFNLSYYQLVGGKTGQSLNENKHYNHVIEKFDQYEKTFVFGGFGIKTPENAAHIWREGFKGAIIGTEMLNRLNKSWKELFNYVEAINYEKVTEIDWEKIEFPSKNILNKKIEVGEHTYYAGAYNKIKFEEQCVRYLKEDKLKIGKFCSIASGVIFNMGGSESHIPSWVSSYPIGNIYPQYSSETGYFKKGDTVIGNDVWLGTECMIMPGVTIVVGAPAKVIKKRFSDDVIAKLLKLKWWDIEFEKLVTLFPYMTSTNIDLFIKVANNIKIEKLEREKNEINFDEAWRNVI